MLRCSNRRGETPYWVMAHIIALRKDAPASTFRIRLLRPDDDVLYPAFLAEVSGSDRRLRFFSSAPVSRSLVHGLTHYDPDTAVAFAAIGQEGELCGVGRLHRIDDGQGEGEFAVLIRSDLKGRGLGRRLMAEVLDAAPRLGVSTVMGHVLAENACMLGLARELGFRIEPDPDDAGLVRVRLAPPAASDLADAA